MMFLIKVPLIQSIVNGVQLVSPCISFLNSWCSIWLYRLDEWPSVLWPWQKTWTSIIPLKSTCGKSNRRNFFYTKKKFYREKKLGGKVRCIIFTLQGSKNFEKKNRFSIRFSSLSIVRGEYRLRGGEMSSRSLF